jgi:hypothetical protein
LSLDVIATGIDAGNSRLMGEEILELTAVKMSQIDEYFNEPSSLAVLYAKSVDQF